MTAAVLFVGLIIAGHTCDAGVVTASITRPRDCAVTAECTLEHLPEFPPDSYRWVCPCEPVDAPARWWDSAFEVLSKWPECP